MKKIITNISTAILLLASLGLLSLTNQGILNLDPPYARGLPEKLSQQNPVVVFQNVTVIPMEREDRLENQTVIVRDGVIESITPAAAAAIPAGAQVVESAGKYLMPGLVDMHVHAMNENELLLFVAYGVTSVRNMWGGMNMTDHLRWREQINQGAVLGPYFYTSGPIMEGPPKTMPLMEVYGDPETAAAAVTEQAAQGYDFIKVYDYLDPPVYAAIVQTAAEQGIPVIGHVPKKVGLEQTLASGQTTIEHLSGFIENDSGMYGVPENELPRYAQMAAQAGTYVCPTIAVYQMYVPNTDLPLLEARPEMTYISPGMRFLWQYFSRPGAMSSITYTGDYPARIQEMFLNTTRILHENGVQFVLGTDSNNPYLVPGASLLDELDYLVAAGFTLYEALETGTRNAAAALGKLDDFGTVTPGKRADLLLLNADPLLDVRAVRDRSGVMLQGRWLTETELQTMLAEMVASFKPTWLERIWPLGLAGLAIALLWRQKNRPARRPSHA